MSQDWCRALGGALLLPWLACTPAQPAERAMPTLAYPVGTGSQATQPANCAPPPLLDQAGTTHDDTLLVCARPPRSTQTRPYPGLFPAESLEQLRRLETDLGACAGQSWPEPQAPCRVPAWLTGSSWADGAVDRRRLARLIAKAPTARLRAIALLWLGAGRDPEALEQVESYLDSREPVGELPHCTSLPEPQDSSSSGGAGAWGSEANCSMRAFTIGEIALRAASAITWHQHRTLAEYRAWRADNPELSRSRAYYSRLFAERFRYWRRDDAVSPHHCRLAQLRERAPELFFLVCLDHLGRAPHRDLLEILRDHLGTERLLAMLREPEQLGLDAAHQRAFAVWVLKHWVWLFGPCRTEELLALWTEDQLPEARGPLAVAASRTHPQLRRSILEAAATETQYDSLVARELAELYLRTDEPALFRFFAKGQHASAAVLGALRRAGASQLAVLSRLLQQVEIPAEDEGSVVDVFATAHVLGAAVLPCEGQLYDVGSGPVDVDKSGPHHTVTDADRKLGAERRRQCLNQLKAALDSQSTPAHP